MSEKIYAPWDEETIRLLRLYQESGTFHPYTCGTKGCKTHYGWFTDKSHLIPTRDGWICSKCDYKQNWASKETIEIVKDTQDLK